MTQQLPEPVAAFVFRLAELLGRSQFERIVEACPGSRLSAVELAEAARAYPATLCPPPLEVLSLVSAVSIEASQEERWCVVLPVWTLEEGRSDLSLELTLQLLPSGKVSAEVDDLHVL